MVTLMVYVFLAATALATQVNGSVTGRVVGGEDAFQDEFPYQIQLRLKGNRHCGGSLVSVGEQQLVITAGHCVLGHEKEDLTAVAGELNLDEASGLEQYAKISRVFIHPNYDNEDYADDVAVLITEPAFELNRHVSVISLPAPHEQSTGNVVLSGWGDATPKHRVNILQKATIPIVKDSVCKKLYANETWVQIVEPMICAGSEGVGACHGDSGGPLALNKNGTDFLIGIVSFGKGCARKDFPAVFMEVSYFVEWINTTVNEIL